MISNCMTVWAAKGGVGKSSSTANLATWAAMSDWRVLVVDLDPQANLAAMLGCTQDSRYDGGQALRDAFATQGRLPVTVLSDVRPGLDVIASGHDGADIESLLNASSASQSNWAVESVQRLIAPVAADYDLILIDLPPTPGVLHRAALTACHYLLFAAEANGLSTDGISFSLRIIHEVRGGTNPDLELLGAVIPRWDIKSTKAVDDFANTLLTLSAGQLDLIRPTIRYASAADTFLKDHGVTAVEIVPEQIKDSRKGRLSWLRGDRSNPAPPAGIPDTVHGIGEDYRELLSTVADRFITAQKAWQELEDTP